MMERRGSGCAGKAAQPAGICQEAGAVEGLRAGDEIVGARSLRLRLGGE